MPKKGASKVQLGCTLRECVRIKKGHYVGLLERTRKDAIGLYRSYAIVRSNARSEMENGVLELLEAVPLRRRQPHEPRRCDATDARAWTVNRDEIYPRFRRMIQTGRL